MGKIALCEANLIAKLSPDDMLWVAQTFKDVYLLISAQDVISFLEQPQKWQWAYDVWVNCGRPEEGIPAHETLWNTFVERLHDAQRARTSERSTPVRVA